MKCPKCHYLSFDPEPRCRNCGYTLSLDADLAIRPEPDGEAAALPDLDLRDPAAGPSRPEAPSTGPRQPRRAPPSAPVSDGTRRPRTTTPGPFDAFVEVEDGQDLTGDAGTLFPAEAEPAPAAAPARQVREARSKRPPPPPTSELPLFVRGLGAEPAVTHEPLDDPDFSVPVDPLPPLGVRRKAPEPPRSSQAPGAQRLGPLDRDLLEGLERIEHAEQRQAVAAARRDRVGHETGAGRRLGAAVFDGALLGGVAAGIVAMTLRWTDLGWDQVGTLPVLPLVGLLLLIVVGYLFVFTAASGQTAGKMLMGLRVVDAGSSGTDQERVTAAQALSRGVLTVPSVVLLGAGFVPALLGDGRAVHDRLTRTRVVRA